MKYLTENERTKELVSKTSIPTFLISYFFYELGDPQEKAFVSLLHVFLYRLLKEYHDSNRASSILIQILEPYMTQTRERPWAQKVLQEALRHIVVKFPVNAGVVLFIDGFDECEGSHADQLDFLKDLVESSKGSKLSIRICLASRADVDIQLRLSNYPSVAIHRFTDPDISSYVAKRLKAAWELMASQPDGTTATFDQELIDNVVQKAEGVFLWVNLVVTQLVMAIEEEAEVSDLHRQVASFPEGLEHLYQGIVAKIPKDRLHDAINLLQLVASTHDGGLASELGADTLWRMCNAMKDPSTAISEKAYFEEGFCGNDAPRPMGQCAAMKRRIQSSCRGLVHCDDTSSLCEANVTFLHRTCVEYILDTEVFSQMVAKADRNLIRNPEVSIMAMALRLLKMDPQYKPQFLAASLEQGRLEFDYWYNAVHTFFMRAHNAECATGSAQTLFVDELDRVCSLLRQEWAGFFYRIMNEELDWHTDVLCLAVYYGLTLYVSQAIENEGQKMFPRAGRPLLCYVYDDFEENYAGDSSEIVQVLLKSGADPNQNFGRSTPWIFYILNLFPYERDETWNTRTISLMMIYGANICQRVSRDDGVWWKAYKRPEHYTTAFHIALTSIKEFTEVGKMTFIRSLLDHCKNYDVVDSDGVGIAEWADTAQYYWDAEGNGPPIDSWIGGFIRAEIAARTTRKRHHSRVEVAVADDAKEAQKKLKWVEHSGI